MVYFDTNRTLHYVARAMGAMSLRKLKFPSGIFGCGENERQSSETLYVRVPIALKPQCNVVNVGYENNVDNDDNVDNVDNS